MITPDGYEAMYSPLATTIRMAYVPMLYPPTGQILGAPGWVNNTPYDIKAKVAPDDVLRWQSFNNTSVEKPQLQSMLQEVLRDRCKLTAHYVYLKVPGFELVIAKKTSALSSAKTGDVIPADAVSYMGGGKVVLPRGRGKSIIKFYNSPIESLVYFLSIEAHLPVIDKTGLKGRYNFVLPIRQITSEESQDVMWQLNPNKWDVESIGLKLRTAKVMQQQVMVDHIERPTDN